MSVTHFIIILIIASSIDLAGEWILTHLHLSPAARIAVACAPIPGNVVLIVLVVQAIRKLDRFKKGGYAVAIRQYA